MKAEYLALFLSFSLLLSGCLGPPNPNNLFIVFESNNAPACIKVSNNYSTMLASCEWCDDFHETPVIVVKNECEWSFVSLSYNGYNSNFFAAFYEGSIRAGTSITNPGETGQFYIHPPDTSSIYIIQKIDAQQVSPSIYEIKYRIEARSK